MLKTILDPLTRPIATEAAWIAIRLLRYAKTREVGPLAEVATRAKGKPADEVAVKLVQQIEESEATDFRQLTEAQVDAYIGTLEKIIRERSILELEVTEALGSHILESLRFDF
ncbi:MAG TPA: hypothetical protein VF173_15500 [Thermoanaerobaculia bacterium]|nr:hypothetical protein [Thermoanaerobaculia bacterium]